MIPGLTLLAGLGRAVTIGVGGRRLIDNQMTATQRHRFRYLARDTNTELIAPGRTAKLVQRGAALDGARTGTA